MSRWFHHYGKICATHPWEVILLVVASTVYLFTIEQSQSNDSLKSSLHQQQQQQQCIGCLEEQFKAVDVVVMTIIRCCAILYSLHQLRNLQTFESKYILGIAGIFPVISSFVYTSTALNFLKITLIDLKDAIFFFLLSSDLTKAAILAQFATTASTQDEISTNIAIGMSILGPTITLDTIVETLVIGVGTLSGVQRLEMLSYFACLAILVNYIIFMTFYPACLSLMLELMRLWNGTEEKQQQLTKKLLENEKVNAAVQRVKIIMSLGLTIVHIHSRWYFKDDDTNENSSILIGDNTNFGFLMKQFALNADHIVILVLVVTLIMKFVFFENDVHLKSVTTIKQHDNNDSSQSTTTSINSEKQVQTLNNEDTNLIYEIGRRRNLEECLEIYRSKGASYLSDCEIILLVDTKHIPAYNLEQVLNNEERGVKIRRQIIKMAANCEPAFNNIPYKNYDYSRVMGVCCENVVGYIPIPLGIVGPLRLDDQLYYVPMSTTEGCLVASTNRGCRAVEFTGVKSQILGDGMTRGPVVRFHSALDAGRVAYWLRKSINFDLIKTEFDSTSRFARLTKIQTCVAGRYLYLRFVAETGDAMGMNMLSKGTEKALIHLQKYFPTMEIISLSGNYCTDKKPAAINWIEGRGKSVVCEAIISKHIVTSVLKTNSKALVDLHIAKNLIGSAMAGSIGGFNAHAANIITAIFIATGQDPAQNITSSNCLTLFEQCGDNGQDLRVSCTMPSIELGTIGGGTILPPQSACLEMLGIKGPNEQMPGENARKFARIVCATVLVGELSLMAALTTGDLVKSHLKHNRSYSDTDNNSEVVVKDC